jgi:sulfur-carrier protein
MIRVELPAHLRTLAGVGYELSLVVAAPVTTRGVLDALEQTYPTLSGTMRDHASGKRRPFVRFFVCGQDWSLKADDAPLPDAIVSGAEPFLIIGAIAGG